MGRSDRVTLCISTFKEQSILVTRSLGRLLSKKECSFKFDLIKLLYINKVIRLGCFFLFISTKVKMLKIRFLKNNYQLLKNATKAPRHKISPNLGESKISEANLRVFVPCWQKILNL